MYITGCYKIGKGGTCKQFGDNEYACENHSDTGGSLNNTNSFFNFLIIYLFSFWTLYIEI
jgi:hypothetical protein